MILANVADGLLFVDITDARTEVTSALSGDVMIVLTLVNKVWVWVGNLLRREDDDTDELARAAILVNTARIEIVEQKTSDVDLLVDSTVWSNAPAQEVQATVIPATSPLHGQILDRSFDPANLPNDQVWASAVTTTAVNDIVLMRLRSGLDNLRYRYTVGGEPEPIYEHSQLPNSDDTWIYFNLAQFAANLDVVLQKRRDATHGVWKGELGGKALEQVAAVEGPAITQLQSLTSELRVHNHDDWVNVAGSGLTPEVNYGVYVSDIRYGDDIPTGASGYFRAYRAVQLRVDRNPNYVYLRLPSNVDPARLNVRHQRSDGDLIRELYGVFDRIHSGSGFSFYRSRETYTVALGDDFILQISQVATHTEYVGNVPKLEEVRARAADLVLVEESPTWNNVTDVNRAAIGLIDRAADNAIAEQTVPSGVAWGLTARSTGTPNVFVVLRVAAGLNPLIFRNDPVFSVGQALNHHGATDGTHDYYSLDAYQPSFYGRTTVLQERAATHHTRFDGDLGGRALTAVEAVTRGLPEFPAEGSRDNKIPKFDGDVLGWEPDGGVGGTGLTTAQAAKLAGITVNDETAARNAADVALGGRIDGIENAGAPGPVTIENVVSAGAVSYTHLTLPTKA